MEERDMRSERYKEEPKKKKTHRALKAVLIIILLLIVAIAAATAYLYKTAKDSISLTLSGNDISVGFGEEHASSEFVVNAEGEVSPSSEFLDTVSLGDKEIVYVVTKPVLGGLLKPSGEYTLRYSVVDKVPPMMIRSGNGTVLERGTEFDINNVISYGDNADPKPALKVDGKVDMDKNGSYPLHVTVTDSSGNETDWDLTVEVADSLPTYEDTRDRTPFDDFVKTYQGKGKVFGSDVSEWQKDIDFNAVKKAGCEFVIIRVGYNLAGIFHYDSKFDYNIKAAKEAGLKVGLYMFSYDDTPETLISATDTVIQRLSVEEIDLPIAFDWEDFDAFQTHGISFYELNKLYDVFAEEMNKAGYDTMLYGSLYRLEDIWTDTDTRPIWLAQYADKPSYKGKYMMWQASDVGRIAGIDTDVDMDIMMPK